MPFVRSDDSFPSWGMRAHSKNHPIQPASGWGLESIPALKKKSGLASSGQIRQHTCHIVVIVRIPE